MKGCALEVMAKTKDSSSLTEEVYEKLYEYIINGDIKPGENLNISSLKEKFKVSLVVVREALIKLTSQGIVVQKPNCGFVVVELEKTRLIDVIEARKINEGAALKLAIRNGDVKWESNILAKEYELGRTPVFLDKEEKIINPDWNDKHYNFHYSIVEGCGNETLLYMCNYLWNISRVYRKQCLSLGQNKRNFAEEHKKLMEAVLDRNEEMAVKLFEQHMDTTKDQMLYILEKQNMS